MKKLINLLLGLTLTSASLSSQDSIRSEKPQLPSQDSIRFENLRDFVVKGAKPSRYDLEIFYEFNKDSCYSEIYVGKIDSSGRIEDPKKPLWYIFYVKRNGKVEIEKIIVDEERDGRNGNETIYIKPKEIQVTSKKEIEI